MEQRRGDTAGRRLARRRAALLAEACRVGHLFQRLLERARVDPEVDITELQKSLFALEKMELERARGHIEPRKRFKGGSSQPLLDGRGRSLLFADECGRATDPNDTHFALGAVAISQEEADGYRTRANELKAEFLGTMDITFHEPMMRTADGPYYFRGDVGRQEEFRLAIDDLVRETDFVAFGVGIRRKAFADFLESEIDPYLPHDVYAIAIQLLLERYVDFLAVGSSGQTLGRVTFESQGALEDARNQAEYTDVLVNGTQWVPDKSFRQWLETSVNFTPKQGSDPMELADMFARDLYEWIKSDCRTDSPRWPVFGTKVYRRLEGNMGKFGVKVFPDSDIRERVLTHRLEVVGQTN